MYQTKSILLPVFNGEKFLKQQIESIITQLTILDELIIFVDGANDRSLSICEAYSNSNDNIILYSSSKNNGLRKAINYLLPRASKEIIVFVDQDDVWLDGRLKDIEKLFKVYDCIIVDANICDENLVKTGESYFNVVKPTKNFLKMLYSCRVLGCCMAFKKSALEGILKIPYGCWHDHFLILWMLLLRKKLHYYKKPLILYRRHVNTLSLAGVYSNKFKRLPAIFFNRVILIVCLIKCKVLK